MGIRRVYLMLAFIAFTAVLNFFPSCNNDYSLDDYLYVDQVSDIFSWSDLPKLIDRKFSEVDYRPVSSITFAIEKIILGQLDPGVSHGVNLLLYILCCLVFYLFIVRFSTDSYVQRMATLAAIIFTILPLHTSMIANIKSRDGLLSFLFGFIFLHILLSLLRSSKFIMAFLYLPFAAAAVFLSVYSKIDGFTFLIAIPLLSTIVFHRFNIKSIIRLIIIILLSYRIATALFTVWTDKKDEIISETINPERIIFTENPIVAVDDFPTKVAFTVQTVFEYMTMMLKPYGHYFYYGYDMIPVLSFNSIEVWLKLLAILALMGLAVAAYFKGNKLLSFGIAFFYIGLLYCSNFITPVSGIVADRYAFIASAGAAIVMAACLDALIQLLFHYISISEKPSVVVKGKKLSELNSGSFNLNESILQKALILFMLLVITPFNIVRSDQWKDIMSIIEADLPALTHRSYEANRIAVENYISKGMVLTEASERTDYFTKAKEYAMNGIAIYDQQILLYEGLILAERGLGNNDAAIRSARETISKFDTSEVAWRILAEDYVSRKEFDAAGIAYKKLTKLVPSSPEYALYYIDVLRVTGNNREAMIFSDSLLKADSSGYLPYLLKGYAYLNNADSANAVAYFEQSFEKGLIDNKLLDVLAIYWWTKDKEKWEYLKKYFRQ